MDELLNTIHIPHNGTLFYYVEYYSGNIIFVNYAHVRGVEIKTVFNQLIE